MDRPTEVWAPIVFLSPTVSSTITDAVDPAAAEAAKQKVEETADGLNLSFFMSDDAKIAGTVPEDDGKKKRSGGRRKAVDPAMVPAQQKQDTLMVNDMNSSYASTYADTNTLLMQTIAQSEQLAQEIKGDIDAIRSSKTLKSKYTYITGLTTAETAVLNTKLAAVKELNSTITQAHNLELKRAADIRKMAMDQKNDDARMMDLYSAFINAPMGMYDNNLNMPKVPEMMLGPNDPTSGIHGMSMAGSAAPQGLTPEQVRMRMEGSDSVEEVVVYDPATGRRWFDVLDKRTGQSVPNYPRSDNFLLEDISIETRAGIARHRNLDRVWPLQTIGGASTADY